jgi:hypothetical protein
MLVGMIRLPLTLVLVATPVLLATPAAANTVGCGDNAFSHADVVTRAPGVRARGPVTSVPDQLCADLIEDRPRSVDSLSVHIGPEGARPGPGRLLAPDRPGAPARP